MALLCFYHTVAQTHSDARATDITHIGIGIGIGKSQNTHSPKETQTLSYTYVAHDTNTSVYGFLPYFIQFENVHRVRGAPMYSYVYNIFPETILFVQ